MDNEFDEDAYEKELEEMGPGTEGDGPVDIPLPGAGA